MRDLIFGTNVSLDGVCDHTKMVASEDVHRYFTEQMRESDTLVYGRTTYQLMVPFWPDFVKSGDTSSQTMSDFAIAFDSVKHYVVFSKSLAVPADGKTTVLRSELRQEILRLKQMSGGPIMTGGVDLPTQLLKLGVIDEFRIMIHPIIVGEGRKLFDGAPLQEAVPLKLIESRPFPSGCLLVRYRRV